MAQFHHPNIKSLIFAFRKARLPQDANLPVLDNTRLTAVNTCPRWAGVRYGNNKTFGGEGRALALEAGTACHYAFSAIRLLQLHENGFQAHAAHHAARMFPRDSAFEDFLTVMRSTDNVVQRAGNVALLALDYSQFYDDPNDKKRTVVNMEEALINYTQKHQFMRHPVWIEDFDDPKKRVGIEMPFDFVVDVRDLETKTTILLFRFIGRTDGLAWLDDDRKRIKLEENKTTGQINSAWISNWNMAHQITGYMMAAEMLTGSPCNDAEVLGLAIPRPKNSPYDGFVNVDATRDMHMKNQWLQWLVNSAQDFFEAAEKPLDAATYTHSCTRYFRECSLMPLCGVARDEQEYIFNNEMVHQEWNPLEEEGT